MKTSESIKNIAAALCKFQQECKSPKKSAVNPHFKSKYAPLEEIIKVATPTMAVNGLSHFQSTSSDGESVIVTTVLMHTSGEFIESDPLRLPMGKATAQGAGSSLTYARRYSLSAILGIAAEEDDDANGASDQQAPSTNKQAASDKQLNLINKLLVDVAKATNISRDRAYETLKAKMKKDMEWYTPQDASQAIKILQDAVKQGA